MTDLGDLLGDLDPAMAIVTTAVDDERAGCLIGFHAQSSIEPIRYAIWLSKANRTYRVAMFAEAIAVHFPSEDDIDLAELFGGATGDDLDKFEQCAWSTGPSGVPLLDRLPNRFVGRRLTVLDHGGDHVCVILEPELVERGDPIMPLRLSAAAKIDAGHPAGERPVPPTLTASTDR
jgi:flavin reductase (DIM6/NTAB) family NADH-FMN oxidoreductase RutF